MGKESKEDESELTRKTLPQLVKPTEKARSPTSLFLELFRLLSGEQAAAFPHAELHTYLRQIQTGVCGGLFVGRAVQASGREGGRERLSCL